MPTHDLIVLSLVIGTGVFVEAVAGFGGTVLALSLGARWFPIEALLAWFLPLNLLLSASLIVRGRTAIERGLLVRRILPMVGLGLAGGTALAWVVVADRAKVAFAGLVVVVAVFELGFEVRAARAPDAPRVPLRAPLQRVLLFAAGVVHGLFATGGPLAVAVVGRMVPSKAAMRATLAVLWLSLNLVVVTRLAVRHDLRTDTLTDSALLLPALAIGLVAGDLVHRRVSETWFRRGAAALLLITGSLLLAAAT